MPTFLTRYASPRSADPLAARLVPWFATLGALLLVAGLVVGLVLAPTDHQQGESYRILYVHVPAAWLAMVCYLAMAFWAAVGLVLNARLSFMMLRALAPSAALLAFLCLWTGALWGKPTWGTWWVWDARLTAVLLLFFLDLGILTLQAAIDDERRGDRAGALLALVGLVNLPVIHWSVQWWNTLHQGASISLGKAPTLAGPMLLGLLLCTAGLWLHVAATVLRRLRCILREREALDEAPVTRPAVSWRPQPVAESAA